MEIPKDYASSFINMVRHLLDDYSKEKAINCFEEFVSSFGEIKEADTIKAKLFFDKIERGTRWEEIEERKDEWISDSHYFYRTMWCGATCKSTLVEYEKNEDALEREFPEFALIHEMGNLLLTLQYWGKYAGNLWGDYSEDLWEDKRNLERVGFNENALKELMGMLLLPAPQK